MFIDQVKIFVKAGDGGNGCVAFRREKYVPMGGPSGGNGGRGGDVILRATSQLTTLLDLKYQQHYLVKRGDHGRGKDQHGRGSEDRIIRVPLGTVVKDTETDELICDLVSEGQEWTGARGGKGGRGNAEFATPTHRSPRHSEEGNPGEEAWLLLELKMIADVGLVGFPNAGKSTLISRVSSARPKVADYPFTTLRPHLGMVQLEDESFVIADIPGLIEGAHNGKGLGLQFLRHSERTAFLLFVIDVGISSDADPINTFSILRKELESYKSDLMDKPFAIAASKLDVKGDSLFLDKLAHYCRENHYDFFPISSVTGEGIQSLTQFLGKKVRDLRTVKGTNAS